MEVPSQLQEISDRLNQELTELESIASAGLSQVRTLLAIFPDNIRLTQFFAYFTRVLFFVENVRNHRLPKIYNTFNTSTVYEIGESLGTLLGKLSRPKLSLCRYVKNWRICHEKTTI